MVMHRQVGVGLVFGAALLSVAATGHAQDVGCCRAECHRDDGRVLGAVMRSTADDCYGRYAGCTVSWTEGPCPEPPGGAFGYGKGGPGRPAPPEQSSPEMEPQD